VRELASSTISGFVRCGFLSIEHLKLQFKEQSKIKLSKRNAQEMVDGVIHSGNEDPLIRRHCGVLGLAALVQSCPYSVPDWLPEIIDSLSTHLHDPAPIPVRYLYIPYICMYVYIVLKKYIHFKCTFTSNVHCVFTSNVHSLQSLFMCI
jgi:hypothetical protein